MFWSNNSVSSSHLETLLSKEDVTLKELMEEEEVLQECKSQNKRLIDYLSRTDVLEDLITFITVEPTGEGDENTRYKYPNIACELLTCEVPQLNQRLANEATLLGKLYSFLESEPPLNPLLASFFSKTFSVLIARTSEQNWYSYQFTCLKVLEFLKSKENCVSLLLKHLGTSAIMDLLFKLITKVEGVEMKQSILNWLNDQKLVQNIVALLDPSTRDSNVHCNAAQLLCDVIRTARENYKQAAEQDCILDRIESPETVSLLLDHILKEPKCETSIIGGISVLLTLLECDAKNTNEVMCNVYGSPVLPADDTPDSTEPSKVMISTIEAILPRLKDFHDVLINPPLKPAVMTTIGLLDPPLGNTRVEVTKLLSVLVANNNLEINRKLSELDTVNVLLDLFFKYSWNNFLHTQVEQCLAFAFNSDIPDLEGGEQKNCLIAHILEKCRLLQRILEAWQDNETEQTVNNRPRRGYVGHLIKISNNIVQQAGKGSFGALMKETVDIETLANWENFASTKLAEINETYKTCLGGVHPNQSTADDNSVEIKDVTFMDNNLQELYTNYYQLQALAPSFTEQFGSFHEEQFNDNEDTLNSSSDPNLEKLSFNINEEDLDRQAVFFEQVCAQKFQTIDDDDGDMWSKRISSKTDDDNKNDEWGNNLEISSSDEEDEKEPAERSGPDGREDTHVEPSPVESLSAWIDNESEALVAPVEQTNPWASVPSVANPISSPDRGWANFSKFESFDVNFGLNLSSDINTTIATSGSCEIETTPLDLTPSDSNVNVDEMFTKEEDKTETSQSLENIPTSVVRTNVDDVANAIDQINLNADENKVGESEEANRSSNEAGPGEETKGAAEQSNAQVNSFQKPDTISDVNSVVNANEQNELIDNFKFLSTQGLITKCGQQSEMEPESGGDGYQLLKENVQAVPNETTQTSSKNVETIGSHSPPVTTTNGPV